MTIEIAMTWNEMSDKATEYLMSYGMKVVTAIIILALGRWVAKVLTRVAKVSMAKAKTDPTLISFLDKLIYISLMVIVIISALTQLGVPATGLVTGLGAAGLAIGLALQGGLSNFAAGILIIFFRPFKIEDLIEAADATGVVRSIELFTTTLVTLDNKTVIIPNSQLTSNKIVNLTETRDLRMDLVFGAGYGDSIDLVKEVCLDVLKNNKRVLASPPPFVGVIGHGESSVNYAVRPWVKASDYWDVYFEIHESIKKAFDEKGVNIPYPHREVFVHNVEQGK